MTSPIPHDYPDWGRYLAQADKVYFNQTVTDIDVITDFNLGFVGDVPFIHLSFEPTLLHQRVRLDFFSNAALTSARSGYVFDARNGTNVDQSVAVLGSFLRLRIEPSAINSACFVVVKSMPYGGRIPGLDAMGNVLISVTNVSIAAGATQQEPAFNIWPGSAVWSVRTAAATFLAELRARNFQAVDKIVDGFDETSTEAWRSVYLPSAQARIHITNNTGAAANFSFYLSARTSLFDM